MSDLLTLAGVDHGVYHVKTVSGATYTLDLDQRQLTRQGTDAQVEYVIADGVPFLYTRILPVRVGESLYADNSAQWRQSTPIVSIERVV